MPSKRGREPEQPSPCLKPYGLQLLLVVELPVVAIGIAKVNDALDEADDGRNAGPAEQNVEDTRQNLTIVEFVDTETTDENAEKAGRYVAFHGFERSCR